MLRDLHVISDIASQYLTPEEEEIIQDYFLDNQINRARLCLLGKIDLLWDEKKIQNNEIVRLYEKLGVQPKDCFLKNPL